MNVLKIVKAYLKSEGFDGLACGECGCGIDDGLMPCESSLIGDCVPAKSVMCDGTCANCEGVEGKDKCYRPVKDISTHEEETHL